MVKNKISMSKLKNTKKIIKLCKELHELQFIRESLSIGRRCDKVFYTEQELNKIIQDKLESVCSLCIPSPKK
jgi:hypothetical protein